jgi:hypothetical protein
MGVFSLFGAGRIKPRWVFTAGGVVWRILFSDTGIIVGEDRDEEARSLNFFFLDESSGKILRDGEKYGGGWWSGIEAIDGTTVYIHGYASPDIPIHKGIIAVDIFSGNILWENPDVRFLWARNGTVVACREYFERSVFYRLDPVRGTVLEETNDRKTLSDLSGSGFDESRYRFPETLRFGEDERSKIIREHVRPEELVGSVEYIEHDDVILFNYYEHNKRSSQSRVVLDNQFKIVSKANEKLIFSEVLDTEAAYPVPDAFFFHNGMLFYIKNRSILTAIQL